MSLGIVGNPLPILMLESDVPLSTIVEGSSDAIGEKFKIVSVSFVCYCHVISSG